VTQKRDPQQVRFVREEARGHLSDAWEEQAERWTRWAREPGHDSYWLFHRDAFHQLLPPPPAAVLDVGCGEGRLPRDMKAWGYRVVGIDGSETLIRNAQAADPAGDYRVADAAALPFDDDSFDLVTAFMTLHDIEDAPRAVAEAARVLRAGGRLCVAVVHPLASAGQFESRAPDARYVVEGSYLEERRYADTVERGGLAMTFHSRHRPLGAYVEMLSAAGLIDRLVEVPDLSDPPGSRWRRVPIFLHVRAVKPQV
jgi:SAM-dependent methyltransferase